MFWMTERDEFDAPSDWEIRAREQMTAALGEVLDVDAGLADVLRRVGTRLYYYRRDGTPYEGPDPVLAWAEDFERNAVEGANQVADDTVTDASNATKSYRVSTVFLGLDHNFGLGGPPVLFETMVFTDDPEFDPDFEIQVRYCTEAQALEGHHEILTSIRAVLDDPVIGETRHE